MKKILGLLGVLAIASSAAARPFPICLYGVDNPEDVPVVKEAGFTCLQTYRKEPEQLIPLAQAAKENGLQVLFYPYKIMDSAHQAAAQDWPVLAWYLVDEPDVAKWSRQRVIESYQKTRAAFPNHPTALVIGQGKTAVDFYDLSDNLMVDWYPVPHLKLTSFGDNVRWAKEGQQRLGAADRPLWGVVQIFDWKEYKQYRPDNDRIGRFPTQEEIRFMSYDGIMNGADGLFYFIFTTRGLPLPQARPDYWARMTAVSQELAALRPVLEQGILVKNPFTVAEPLSAQTRLYDKQLYTILINRSDSPVPAPKKLRKKKYTLLYGGEKAEQIPPYAVWVIQRKK